MTAQRSIGLGAERHAPATLPQGKKPGTQFIVDWVGLGTGLDGCGKSCPHRNSIPGKSLRSDSLCGQR